MRPKPVINGKKTCTKCGEWKPLSEFNCGKSTNSKRSQCRNCERDYKMMRRYQITKDQVADFWKRKNCEICGHRFSEHGSGKGRHKCIDHDHKTGLARGILCNACNSAIGYFGDDTALIAKAIRYLEGEGSLLEKELEDATNKK